MDPIRNTMPSPLILESCKLVYTCGFSPVFDAARPYLLPDQLVTHTSTIPGILRSNINSNHVPHGNAVLDSTVSKPLDNIAQHPTKSVELGALTFHMEKSVFRYACRSVHLLYFAIMQNHYI